jgi:hypothetical protein
MIAKGVPQKKIGVRHKKWIITINSL